MLTIPETCVPTVTDVTGSIVPVAVMLFLIVVDDTVEVSKETCVFFLLPDNNHAVVTIMIMPPMPSHILLILFILFILNINFITFIEV